MAEIQMDIEQALVLAGKGAQLHPPIDRVRCLDARALEFWSSEDWRDEDERACVVICAGGTSFVRGFVMAPLSEVADE